MSYNPSTDGSTGNQTFQGSARSLATGYQNGTVGTLTQSTPVSINLSGQMINVDITSDSSVAGIIGLVSSDTPSAAKGLVTDSGRLENITTSFSVGDAVYINFDGTLTNVRPDLTVSGWTVGMYMIFIGVIVMNQFNPSQKDLKIYLDVLGQL